MTQQSSCELPCCPSAPLKRPRYFPRQLITPAEMNLEQAYFRERHKLHNRMLHGWGSVCGALVCPIFDEVVDENGNSHVLERPWCVVVKPGYLLGPYGDEIYIDSDQKVDLRSAGVRGTTGDSPGDVKDPWCSEVWEKCDEGPVYIAVRYRDVLARPVPVQPVGCGCDEASCEYSRWCDGFEICVLPECPKTHQDPPDQEPRDGPIPPCPPCSDSPWVVLAEVELGPNGAILRVDNCSCRRMVVSYGNFWWQCEDETAEHCLQTVIEEVAIIEGHAIAGRQFQISVAGREFPLDAVLSAADLTFVMLERGSNFITATVTVAAGAQPGLRSVSVVDRDGNVLARSDDAFIVEGEVPGRTTKKKTTKKKTSEKRAVMKRAAKKMSVKKKAVGKRTVRKSASKKTARKKTARKKTAKKKAGKRSTASRKKST